MNWGRGHVLNCLSSRFIHRLKFCNYLSKWFIVNIEILTLPRVSVLLPNGLCSRQHGSERPQTWRASSSCSVEVVLVAMGMEHLGYCYKPNQAALIFDTNLDIQSSLAQGEFSYSTIYWTSEIQRAQKTLERSNSCQASLGGPLLLWELVIFEKIGILKTPVNNSCCVS